MAFAALALLNTALMATADRRAKLGLVRLIGATRRQARRMIAWEALIATLAGLVGTLVPACLAQRARPMAHSAAASKPVTNRKGLAVSIQRRAFGGVADLPLVVDPIRAMPPACRHVIDFAWRLTAPAIAAGGDAVYWRDAGGRVVGLAAWQQAWATLDFYVRPGPDAVTVERDIFAWAGGRFRERDAERGHRLRYSVEFRDDDQDRQALAAAHGFVRNVHASHVHLQRKLDALPPLPAVPDGFAIRPLADAAEAAAYAGAHRAAFGSEAMTAQWRERTIDTPLYQPDLDLVAAAPDGTLAGFCVGWHEPARGVAQLEPVGVHPRYQRRGLSRALLTEMLRRLKLRGASVAIAETELDQTAARAAYDAVGFKQTHTIWRQEAWATDVS